MIKLKQKTTVVGLYDGNFLSRLPNMTEPFLEVGESNLLVSKDTTNQAMFQNLNVCGIRIKIQGETLIGERERERDLK
jgi:hypothetical protein